MLRFDPTRIELQQADMKHFEAARKEMQLQARQKQLQQQQGAAGAAAVSSTVSGAGAAGGALGAGGKTKEERLGLWK